MAHSYTPDRRASRFRGPMFATFLALIFGACETADLTDPTANTDPVPAEEVSTPEELALASSFRGGIPIGTTAQPTSAFGGTFNGALRNIWPKYLVKELAAIKARGGKVVLMFAGANHHYQDRRGHFDLGKWKARVGRFKGTNFNAYVKDGTIIGHYLIDEPNDPSNWNGKPIPPSVVEEMAKFSKQHWPNMVTIVRTEPTYLNKWSGKYRYLDAAWAQYVERKGNVNAYIQRNVADAQKKGLGLVVGLNISKGALGRRQLSANQIRTWGSVLLSSSYPCAFISWRYEPRYASRSDFRSAMAHLAGKARSRATKSCRAGGGSAAGGAGSGGGDRGGSAGGGFRPDKSRSISLKATGWSRGKRQTMRLTWSGARGSTIDIYRNGRRIERTRNDGHDLNGRTFRGRATYRFKVCERGTSNCSNIATFRFK